MNRVIRAFCTIFFSFFFSISLQSMERPTKRAKVDPTEVQSPISCMLFSPDDNIVEHQIKVINETPKGGFVGVWQRFFTNKKLIKAIEAAHARGVRISIRVDKRHGNTIKEVNKLKEKGMEVYVLEESEHTKSLLIAEIDPVGAKKNKNSGWKVAFIGSENLSQFAGKHYESVEKTKNEDLFDQLYAIFSTLQDKPIQSNKEIIIDTPKKAMVYHTRDTQVNESLARRIAKEGKVTLSTMTFDSSPIAKALMKKGPDATLMMHASVLSSERGREKVEELKDSGVKVLIFDPYGDQTLFGPKVFWLKQLKHDKLLLREPTSPSEKSLLCVMTGNATRNSGQEGNILVIHPDQSPLKRQVRQHLKSTAKRSLGFEKIDSEKRAEKREQESRKRKLAKENRQNNKKRTKPNVRYESHCPVCQRLFYSNTSASSLKSSARKHLEKLHKKGKKEAHSLVDKLIIQTQPKPH